MVVPIYNVEDYLVSCLESLADQTFRDTEVILVDDGSPDTSGDLAEEFAAGRENWRVLHVENGGLGRARNIGLDAATADYIAFIDSDDVVPRDAFELMMHAIEGSGSDIVSGGVLRYDGARTRPSGLHRRAVPETRIATHVRQMPSLLYDTTAWNKVYRRTFLLQHGLRFPEGVLYEDLPLTIPALCLAGPVACVHEPVYAWRTRQHGLSITQRRHELENLRDRFTAVGRVDAFLEEHELHDLRVAHDDKVLGLDLPLYTAALPEADEEYRAAYLAFFAHLSRGLTPARRRSLPPTLRLYVELAEAGRMDALVAAVTARRGERPWAVDRRSRPQRVRQDLATYRLERELGLATPAQVLRRAAASTLKILLPSATRRPLGALRQRLAGRRADGRTSHVPSVADQACDHARTPADPASVTIDGPAPAERQVKDA